MSALPPIEPYVETYFWLSGDWNKGLPAGFVRRDTIEKWLTEKITQSLVDFGSEVSRPYPWLGANLFDRLFEEGSITAESNAVAGTYYSIDIEHLKAFRNRELGESDIYRQFKIIGQQFFTDVFEVYSSQGAPVQSLTAVEGIEVPASDRIVSLNHNQVAEISDPLTELIGEFEKTNGDPDVPGLRERILGQLRAGRELILAGTFRAYLLYSLLLNALGELISRHKGTAIAAAAEALLGLLVQHIFSGN